MSEPEQPPSPLGKAARNEGRKALAATCNAVSIAMLITSGVQPLLSGSAIGPSALLVLFAFVALQGLAHYVLRKVED